MGGPIEGLQYVQGPPIRSSLTALPQMAEWHLWQPNKVLAANGPPPCALSFANVLSSILWLTCAQRHTREIIGSDTFSG